MKILKPTAALFIVLTMTFISCKKEFSLTNTKQTNETISPELFKQHNEKVKTWFNALPFQGKFINDVKLSTKTISHNNQVITRIKINNSNASFLFISTSKQFHAYGLKEIENSNNSATYEIFDFQTLQKKGIKFKSKKLTHFIKYDSEKIINAYKNEFPLVGLRRSSNNQTSTTNRTLTEENLIIKKVRKFFCELFGGTWIYAPYSLDTPTEYCALGNTNGEEQTIDFIASEDWSTGNWGLIFQNINNQAFFDNSSQLWNNINTAGTTQSGGSSINTSIIDPDCTDPDRIRSLLFILNLKYNQQPPGTSDLSLDDTFEQFKLYKTEQQVLIPIIPWLIKAGANGAADALMQALFIYLTEDDCPSYGAAFGHDKFSKTQVARSAAEGLLPWKTPGGKLGRAAFTAMGDIMVNLIDGKYGENNYQQMGYDFMAGFFSDLAGGAAGELASKYALPKIGKGLLNKFDIHYKTVASWLGGGLQQINKSFVHNGQTITASRVMKGFADNKVAVIGRSMSTRVNPFASHLSSELGVPVLTWPGFNSALSEAQNVANNRAWIKSLKEQGYTFYDIGLDPGYTSGQLNGGIPDFTEGAFYKMELDEIFR